MPFTPGKSGLGLPGTPRSARGCAGWVYTFAGDQVLGPRAHTFCCTPSPLRSHHLLPSGPTYQNPKSHDFEHTFEREEGGEHNVEHSKGVFIGQRGSVELKGRGQAEKSVAWLRVRLQVQPQSPDRASAQPRPGP